MGSWKAERRVGRPGCRVVVPIELAAMHAGKPQPYLINVLGGDAHRTIAGAFWLRGASAGDMNARETRRFLDAMGKFAAGDRSRAMVFFCADSRCWLSYNAALRAIAAGYTNIMWYRGGLAAWNHAALPMMQSEPFAWCRRERGVTVQRSKFKVRTLNLEP